MDEPSADDTDAEITSRLHAVEPTVIRPGDQLTLSGVVENTGEEPLTNVQALPRWSNVQLETRAEISRVSSDPSLRWGIRYDNPYQVVAERLDPGESRRFELVIDDVDAMGLGNAGAYVVGVDIRGTLSTGDRPTLDTTRTVVPWLPGESPAPVDVALLWPVEAQPSLLPDGSLYDDSLARRIAADGSLTAIVEQADSRQPLTWLVDPDVIDTVDVMADGYEVGPPGDRETGEGTDAAREWRTAFDEVTGGRQTFLLPYARPDVDALLPVDRELAAQLVDAAVDATAEAGRELEDVRTGVTRPEGGADEEVLSVWADAGVRTVILSGATVSPGAVHPLARTSTSAGELDVILTDPGLDAAVADAYADTDPAAGILDLRQRWAAEAMMVALEADARSAEPEALVVAPPPAWQPTAETAAGVVDTWGSVPWVNPVSVTDLDPPAQPATVTPEPVDTAHALPADNVDAAEELRAAAHDYASLLADPDPSLATDLELVALRSASSGWREDPEAGVEYSTVVADEFAGQLEDVQVTIPESVTLSSSSGIFPLTVTNELDQPVNVNLAIQAANPDRLRIDELPTQRVEAGTRQTIEVRAEAATNGRVPITVQLVTSEGSPLGPAQQAMVNATDYGTVGWIIIAAAGGLFGAAVVRTTLRRRAAGTADSSEHGEEQGPAAKVPARRDRTPEATR